MDSDPIYWDEESASATRYGGVVAPPLYPLHALRVHPGAPDPFARAATDPDFDGSVRGVMKGLKPLPIPLTRVLNGGNEVEIYQLARPGEKIRVKSKYLDIYQKEGRTGTMVFLLTETIYTNEKGDLLLKAIQTRIMR
jgi:acyl dehydratase